MDTGPQKESNTPQEAGRQRRERKKERGRAKGKTHFKARPERQVGNYSNTGRNKTDNMSSKLSKSGCFTYKFTLEKKSSAEQYYSNKEGEI